MKKIVYTVLISMLSLSGFAQNDTLLYEDFEELIPASGVQIPEGWKSINANNDLYKWDVIGNDNGFNSVNAINIPTFTFDIPTNDWLFTNKIPVKAGRIYQVSFVYRNSPNYLSVEKLSVKWGNSQDASSMKNLVMENLEITNTEFEESIEYISSSSDDSICIGFHCISQPDQFVLIVDEVRVIELSNQKEIATFSIPTQIGNSTIDSINAVVKVIMPEGTNLNGLSPIYTVSEGASIDPGSGTSQNFSTDSVDYVVNAADMSFKIWKVVVSVNQGIANNSNKEFQLFPNPTNGLLNINTLQNIKGATVTIINSLGQLIKETTVINEFQNEINVSALPAGIYQIIINNHSDYLSKQFMVQ